MEYKELEVSVEVVPIVRAGNCYGVYTVAHPGEKQILFSGATALGLPFNLPQEQAYEAARRWIELYRADG